MDVLNSLESGEKFLFKVPGLDYEVELPLVVVPSANGGLRIASLNLVGQIRLNRDMGKLMAAQIREVLNNDLEGVVILTVVEKALQLTQVVAEELGMDAVAVAFNRVKPHMEASRRPVIQIGVDSITSGGKFLAVYERDMNLLLSAHRGFVIIDDVVSTGGTILGLVELIEELRRRKGSDDAEILGIFCAAQEGAANPLLPAPVYSLAQLPKPTLVEQDS